MSINVDVVIIGAGTAGLNAVSQIKRANKSFVLVNGGELGTTCARVGCMPSKAMIYTSNVFHGRKGYKRIGINGAEQISLEASKAMKHIRNLRDYFVSSVLENISKLGNNFIEGYAKFEDCNHIRVNDDIIGFEKAVIATGTQPIIPKEWQQFRKYIITTDEIFELEELPQSIAVIGLGAIGLEIGQALHRMGVNVTGFSRGKTIGHISDETINELSVAIFGKEIDLFLGKDVSIERNGSLLTVSNGENSIDVERALICVGRKPNLNSLSLENLDITQDENGLPIFDHQTMQVENTNIFIAGDVNKHFPVLHEAADEGKIAGYNACAKEVKKFKRKIPFSIIFTDPNIYKVGQVSNSMSSDNDYAIGNAEFENSGRPLIMGKDQGMLRIYAEKKTNKVVGSIMIGVQGEHLAHLLAWAVSREMTVLDMLNMPYYHPVMEEYIQTALKDLLKKLDSMNVPVLGLEIED